MDNNTTKQEEVPKTARTSRANCSAYIIGGSILISAVLISGSLIYGFRAVVRQTESGNSAVTAAAQTQTAPVAQPTAVAPAQQQPAAGTPVNIALKPNTPYLGSNSAKVTVVEFADYECPYCEQFFKNTWPELKAKYVVTGKIKFVYQDFAFLGPDSNTAAEASHCAADQNMFWQYHDYLFSNQGAEGSGWAAADHQKQFAAAVGLNTAQFDQCLDSGKYKQEVLDETAAGRSYGVTGTPTVFINGTPIVGNQSVQQFEQAIDSALAK
jgi:protein-disulfide isomerase